MDLHTTTDLYHTGVCHGGLSQKHSSGNGVIPGFGYILSAGVQRATISHQVQVANSRVTGGEGRGPKWATPPDPPPVLELVLVYPFNPCSGYR